MNSELAPRAAGSPRQLAAVAAGALFMEGLDATGIATALPAIAADFGVGVAGMSVGISAYFLAGVACIPASGWLADRFGERRLLCAAIVLFTLASVLCGASSGFAGFIASRLLQGAAAAMMTPVARLAVVRHASKTELLHAVAIMTWPALIAPVVGPPLGGLLADHASWRWIFFVNVPVGVLGVVLAWRWLPRGGGVRRRPLDVAGLLLLAAALASLVLGLELLGGGATVGGHRGRPLGAGLLAAGACLCALALRRARRHPHPVFDLAASAVPSFAIANLSGGFLSRVAIGATPFLLPLLFQLGLGLSAAASGLLLLAYFAGNIAMKLVTTRILRRFGFKRVLLVNGLALAATVAAAALFAPGWPLAALVVALVLAGCARSLQMTALNSLSFADVAAADAPSANVLASLMQQIAMTTSVAGASLLLQWSLGARGGAALALPDFAAAFLGVAVAGAVACAFYRRLAADAGAQVSGRGEGQRRA